MLKLFTRLKEISGKFNNLPTVSAKNNPTDTPTPSPESPANPIFKKIQDISGDLSGKVSTMIRPIPPQPNKTEISVPQESSINNAQSHQLEDIIPITDDEQSQNNEINSIEKSNPNSTELTTLPTEKNKPKWTSAIAPLTTVGSFIAKPFTGPKPIYKRPLFWVGTAVTAAAVGVGGLWWYIDDSVSSYQVKDLVSYIRPGTLTVKAADGKIILQRGNATREALKLWQYPQKLRQAFIAIEDRRFYEHDGIDYKGVSRAVFTNVTSGEAAEGGSSITQQVARIVYLDQEKSIWRKIREARLAQKLEAGATKDQILERYLQLVYLGEGVYGAADAAWVYFSKTVDELTLAEMATLAALPPAPNKYSPFESPDFAKKRRNLVLQRMQEAGFITPQEAEKAKNEELKLKRGKPQRLDREALYFNQYIEQELPKYVSPEQIKKGVIVETTLNPKWQQRAEEVIQSTVRNNRGSFGQASIVSIDPRNGTIKAMVGGNDFEKNQYNRVTQAKRQPGSTFKPFVYATAIAGGISPYKTYLDAPYIVDGYKPNNASKSFKGSVSMRDALVNSINIVAIKVLIDAGFDPVMNLAKKMGIESELKPFYSLALGGIEVNLLELTNAYGTFATQGIHTPVHGISRVIDHRGQVIYDSREKIKSERVLTTETSAIMTWMMSGVVNEGTATSAQIGRPVAGKTGTTDKAKDLWFIGFIPQLVTGVWLGNDNNTPTGNASSTAAYAWSRFMRDATKDMPIEKLPGLPENINKRKAELKLDPVRPRYQRTLAAPANDDKSSGGAETRSGRRSRVRDEGGDTETRSNRRSRVRDEGGNSESRGGGRSRRNRQ